MIAVRVLLCRHHVQVEAIRSRGMAAHAPFGTWLLEDEPDAVCIRHLHGRKFMTDSQRAARGFPLEGRGVRSLGAMQTSATH